MSELSEIFKEGCKVVVSPDKMRAWVTLARPSGAGYTAEAIARWLPENGVVYGADAALIKKAAASGRYDELLEVARGAVPVAASGGDYTLKIDKKPFTGLKGASDGALFYDDLSFLHEVQPGQVLAEVIPPAPARPGMTVTGEPVPPREGSPGRELTGSGYVMSDDGRSALAPVLGHVNIVNEQLVVTPLLKVQTLAPGNGPLMFDGNVLVEKDLPAGTGVEATGSVFVVGRAVSAHIKAGNNVLISGGMRSEGGAFGSVEAKGSVWGLFFESCQVTAGGDICANHLSGCEVSVQGRANILGGRGAIAGTTLFAKSGVVAAVLGDPSGVATTVDCGLNQDFMNTYLALGKKTDRLGTDIQALQQNITAFERLNRMKPDKGKNDPQYKEMLQKRNQSLSVLNILNNERTRMRRTLEQSSGTAVIARESAWPGLTVSIDTRSHTVTAPLKRVRFKRSGEEIQVTQGTGGA